jgi:hypothetical protein
VHLGVPRLERAVRLNVDRHGSQRVGRLDEAVVLVLTEPLALSSTLALRLIAIGQLLEHRSENSDREDL